MTDIFIYIYGIFCIINVFIIFKTLYNIKYTRKIHIEDDYLTLKFALVFGFTPLNLLYVFLIYMILTSKKDK